MVALMWWSAALLLAYAGSDDRVTARNVSIVAAVKGQATIRLSRTSAARPLLPFEWLDLNSRIETERNAEVTLAFENGDRYQIEPLSSVVVKHNGVQCDRGRTRKLDPVPPWPILPPVRSAGGTVAAAVRIRGRGGITGLYPDGDANTIADSTTLRFNDTAVKPPFHFEVQDDTGNMVHQAEVSTASVLIPPGVLRPGSSYFWHVSAKSALGILVTGEAEFHTLPDAVVQRRAAVRAALPKNTDALLFEAEIDRSLRLYDGARESLEEAVSQSPTAEQLSTVSRLKLVLDREVSHLK